MTFNLVYMAKPTYGGWVSFTAHMALKYNFKIYKIAKRTEKLKDGKPRMRKYGYGAFYQNIHIEDLKKLPNILITAIDKNYYNYLNDLINVNNIKIVIHDPTEVKKNSCKEVLDFITKVHVFTIRRSVQKFLLEKYNIKSEFKYHPFYEYHTSETDTKNGCASISRIDFDKHTEIILKANGLLKSGFIDIYGAKNDRYVYFKLNKLGNFDKYYKGSFKKDFEVLDNILHNKKFIVDLSIIKNDGGGSQYTFLEAIHQKCVLILHEEWVKNYKTVFKNNYNCLIVSNENDLVDILNNSNSINIKKLIKNSKKLLEPHINVIWG